MGSLRKTFFAAVVVAITTAPTTGAGTLPQNLASQNPGAAALPQSLVSRYSGGPAVVVDHIADPAERPTIVPREVWGARDANCAWPGTDGTRITHAVIHHTYEPTDPPSLESAYAALRHIQNLHMDDNGWCDIGYSYLVDWFGNVYEGTAGTIAAPVTSAHTAGLNFEGIGVAMIGNYMVEYPTAETITAAGRVAAWALGWYGVDSAQDVQLTVAGANNKWAAGTRITVPAITAHRDVVTTECPGDAGYLEMPALREVAATVTAAMRESGAFGSGSAAGGGAIFDVGAPLAPVGNDGELVEGAEDAVADLAHESEIAVDEPLIVVDPEIAAEAQEVTLNIWWWAAVGAAIIAAFAWWWFAKRRPNQQIWDDDDASSPGV